MELLITILIYLGLLSPDAAISITQAEVNALATANQAIVRDVMNDPATTQLGPYMIKDRQEDGSGGDIP